MLPSIFGITSEMKRSREVIEEIYSSSIEKIQATFAASDSRGNYQKTNGVTIEYIATRMNGERAFVKAIGYLDNNSEVIFKEIRLLRPYTEGITLRVRVIIYEIAAAYILFRHIMRMSEVT
ncbi:17869_t:CDS:2 [Cetraspora pellucida]|uniref:17869_t:CDS:1 n=1 Tax=Cetraspora pellucida TaxID=1433469 RepID=A0A9N9H3A3_9GLOM|nr:17869_t:CDS:2 [Cetraspora pellucida]